MLPSERSRQEVVWILGELLKQNSNRNSSEPWIFEFHDESSTDIPTFARTKAEQTSLLYDVAKLKVIGIKSREYDTIYHGPTTFPSHPPRRAIVEIHQPAFDEICRQYGVAGARPLQKPAVLVSKKKGVYLASDPAKVYPVLGKRSDIIFYLLEHESATAEDIRSVTYQEDSAISNAIKSINKVFRKKVIDHDLISHTIGYIFNEALDVQCAKE
jgi:hypothetical protein